MMNWEQSGNRQETEMESLLLFGSEITEVMVAKVVVKVTDKCIEVMGKHTPFVISRQKNNTFTTPVS